MADPKCAGTTKKGAPCKSTGVLDNGFCMAHQPEEVKESRGFGGAQAGAGRPANPRAVDVLRERIEQDIDKVLDPLWEALEAESAVVVGSGRDSQEVEMVPDYRTRITAARELMDRAYGKPKQQTEISGPDGGPVATELITDPQLRNDARDLLERAAGLRSS